ncbi:hypothetical protein Pla110_13870 [Polystyrenella longa]|uniref:Uncharacterized protein n=1 Tax=Polystyrenella longa TaxID=2528007 RepID=A0A518CKG8_9PLAN|nr:hypothetical protein Pla110_13870 [Polystyrenella longa]
MGRVDLKNKSVISFRDQNKKTLCRMDINKAFVVDLYRSIQSVQFRAITFEPF